MTSLIKEIFFRLVRKKLPGNRASILTYHSVSDRSDYFANILPSEFKQQMECVAEKKRIVISLTELVRRLKNSEPLGGAIALTFDDGYQDNYTNAFPVLKRFNFPATIFVTTDQIDSTDKRGMRHLSLSEMKEMEASGLISIEPHTKSHPKLVTLSSAEAQEEIAGSKKVIEDLFSKTAILFAYPYGNFNDDTVRIVKGAGLKAAVTVKEGTVGAGCDPFRLPRNSIDRTTTFVQFRGKISTAIDWYHVLKKWK